jgi:ketosteroid isomerase-like protein
MSDVRADPTAVVQSLLDAMGTHDLDAIDALLSDDVVTEYPQSGEIIRGRSNLRAIFENFQGGLPAGDRASVQTIGSDEWAMTPAFTLVRLTGAGSLRTAIAKSRYPDGSMWWVIQLLEVHDGRITRVTAYFAPAFEAPAWRAQWVERRT